MASAQSPEEMYTRLTECMIPPYMHEGIVEYIFKRRPIGSFLYAVLTNNLREACNRADNSNKYLLYQYIFFFYNYAPMACWGSEEMVDAWLARRAETHIDSPS